jgi:hypothetical protein
MSDRGRPRGAVRTYPLEIIESEARLSSAI